MKVKTLTATVGVRGTKFGTEIKEMPSLGVPPRGTQRVASLDPVMMAAGPGQDRMVNIFVSQGTVRVTSLVDSGTQMVGENEWIGAGPLGLDPVIYDPDRVRSFMDSVEGPLTNGRDTGVPSGPGVEGQGVKLRNEQEEEARRQEQIMDIKQREMEEGVVSEPSHPHHPPSPPGGGCSCP